MHRALRPYLTTGVAIVGASVIAVAPIQPIPTDMHASNPLVVQVEREVALAANEIEDGINALTFVAADALVSLAKLPAPLVAQLLGTSPELTELFLSVGALVGAGPLIGGAGGTGAALQDVVDQLGSFDLEGLLSALIEAPFTVAGGVLNGGTGPNLQPFIPIIPSILAIYTGGLFNPGNINPFAGPLALPGVLPALQLLIGLTGLGGSADMLSAKAALVPPPPSDPLVALANIAAGFGQSAAALVTSIGSFPLGIATVLTAIANGAPPELVLAGFLDGLVNAPLGILTPAVSSLIFNLPSPIGTPGGLVAEGSQLAGAVTQVLTDLINSILLGNQMVSTKMAAEPEPTPPTGDPLQALANISAGLGQSVAIAITRVGQVPMFVQVLAEQVLSGRLDPIVAVQQLAASVIDQVYLGDQLLRAVAVRGLPGILRPTIDALVGNLPGGGLIGAADELATGVARTVRQLVAPPRVVRPEAERNLDSGGDDFVALSGGDDDDGSGDGAVNDGDGDGAGSDDGGLTGGGNDDDGSLGGDDAGDDGSLGGDDAGDPDGGNTGDDAGADNGGDNGDNGGDGDGGGDNGGGDSGS